MRGGPRSASDSVLVERLPLEIEVAPRVAVKREAVTLRWRLLLLLVIYLGVLGAVYAVVGGTPRASVWDLQDPAYIGRWLAEATGRAAILFGLFVPIGVLVRSATARTSHAAGGEGKPACLAARCAKWAIGLAAGTGAAVLATTLGLQRIPTWGGLVLPLLAVGSGVWLSWMWSRNAGARWWLVSKLALAASACILTFIVFGYLAIQDEPLRFTASAVTTDGKRRIVDALRHSEVPGTPVRRLDLTEEDVNVALAWGLGILSPNWKARVAFTAVAEPDGDSGSLPDANSAVGGAVLPGNNPDSLQADRAIAQASLKIPWGSHPRFLNVRMEGRCAIQKGRRTVYIDRMRVGRLTLPGPLVTAVVWLTLDGLDNDPEVGPLLRSVDGLRIHDEGIQVTARKGAFRENVLPALLSRLGADRDVVAATREHFAHLVDILESLPGGDTRFAACVQAAFQFAAERSRDGGAVRENKAAVNALGILLGHWRVERLVGRVSSDAQWDRVAYSYRPATLRGREDWCRHFWVSAALALASSRQASNAAGLLKEELDAAHGGSGFSFSDLLADRAGTEFALAATRDEASATRMQNRLRSGFAVGDVFPEAADLPEGINDAELARHYGGVGGKGYQHMMAEIERRVASTPAMRPLEE